MANADKGFYAYRVPGGATVCIATDCTCMPIGSVTDTHGSNLFIISEFNGAYQALSADSEIEVPVSDLPAFPAAATPQEALPAATGREEYLKGAERIISALRAHPDRKVVYSRVIVAARRFGAVNELFMELCRHYPDAYVFCYYTPQTGLWIGASPELLCEKQDGVVRSMALAGTKRAEDTSPWDAKNIEEQAFVARFIAGKFEEAGLDVQQSDTRTVMAGPVKHLCTYFTSRGEVSTPSVLRLPELLSPTPALCGTPREYAMEMIRACESHERRCYGGFVGRVTASGEYLFWVNLRCMQVFPAQVALYVGGGLTHLSVAADEWEETAAKAKTLA